MEAEPGFGGTEVAGDGDGGDAEDFGDFVGGHAAEVAHFNGLGFAFVEASEGDEGVIKGEEGDSLRGGEVIEAIEADGTAALAAFEGEAFPGKVDENLAHETGGDVVEVGAVDPIGLTLLGEAEEGFVDEFGGGEVAVAADGEAGAGELAEFGVDQIGQFGGGDSVAGAPAAEELGHRAGSGEGGLVSGSTFPRIHHCCSVRERAEEFVMGGEIFFWRGEFL